MSTLSDLLTRENTGGLSARAISRAARDAGYTLNHDTAARYLRGDHGTPDEPTLRALSEVLGVSMSALRRAADLPSDDTAPYVPPAESSRLSRRQRRAVDEIIRAMLEMPPDLATHQSRPARGSLRAVPDVAPGKAARRGKSEKSSR
jgi:hypothetical protein